MINILLKILEKFTLDYIPSLPIGLRTQLYKNILPIRKLKDKVLLNKPKSQQTFQDKLKTKSQENLERKPESLKKRI